jgi:complex iron-sulfur molybdoenzyme family reductase subunit gamma
MRIPGRSHWRAAGLTLGVLVVAGLLQFANANPAVSQSLYLIAYDSPDDPGLSPSAAIWNDALSVRVPLSGQVATYAAGGGSIKTVRVQAVHYQTRLYMRVAWDDATTDESTTRVQDFSDAVALEFPARSASTVPSICMGQADAGVNIWQWRADSQRGLHDPVEIYTGALVDFYPSTDTLFYTAREAGNPYANPEQGPVQTLVSRAFGTLSPANVQDVAGKGERVGDGWAVVFSRDYNGSDADQAGFSSGTTTDMAVAVWNGSEGDRNGRKSVSQFVTLKVSAVELPQKHETNLMVIGLAIASIVALSGMGAAIAAYGVKESGRK